MYSLKIIQMLIFSFFILVYSIIYMVTTDDKDKLVKLTLDQQLEYLQNNYKISENHFKIISDNFYNNVLSKKEVTKLMYQAKYAKTDSQRAIIREKLYEKMKPLFTQFTKSGVNIMLFAFEDNTTFLRVHKPDKYGDNLSDVRYSFKYVNDKKEVVRGFEQGKISHAFRNVFPLYYENEYVGSVDFAFASEVLQENMIKLHNIDTHFIVDKTIFDVNIWKMQNKVRYVKSIEHDDFLFSLTSSKKDNTFASDKLELNKELKDEIYQNIKNKGSFSLYRHNENTVGIISFLPIKNIKDKKTVAYIVSYAHSYYLESMLHKYIWINFLFFIGLIILACLISNNVKQRFLLEERVKEEVAKNEKQSQFMFMQSRLAQMGEMISMIAHQWRQPLAAIAATLINVKIQSELETFNLKDAEEAKKYEAYVNNEIKKIDNFVQNLTTTIDDFRNFYKPNKETVSVKLDDVISKSLRIIEASLINDNIKIIKEYEYKDDVNIHDREMLQVILNILKNAQDNFAEKQIKNPYIKITTKDKSIIICDNGGGIPQDIAVNFFDPFFSTKSEKNGTGLGLYMSKIIVEEHHNGKLSVKNTDDGVCFTIELV